MKISTITSMIFITVFSVASFFSPAQAKATCCKPAVAVNINLAHFFVARPHLCWEGFYAVRSRPAHLCVCKTRATHYGRNARCPCVAQEHVQVGARSAAPHAVREVVSIKG